MEFGAKVHRVVFTGLLITSLSCGTDVVDEGTPFEFQEEPAPDMAPADLEAADLSDGHQTCETYRSTIEAEDFDFSLVAPNIYIMLDTSGSMGKWENCQDPDETDCCPDCTTPDCCMEMCCDQREPPYPIHQARDALDVIADTLASHARFGMGHFPPEPTEGALQCGLTSRLAMGQHPAREIKQSYASIEADGPTPTGTALYALDDRNLVSEPGDPLDTRRTKAVILITDGDPTVCENFHPSVEQTAALAEQGIEIYVVGFRSAAEEEVLNGIAEAGGTDNMQDPQRRFFIAENTDQLVAVLRDITRDVLGCRHRLQPRPEPSGETVVRFGGEQLHETEYSYDATSGVLQLSLERCQQLLEAEGDQDVEVLVRCGRDHAD